MNGTVRWTCPGSLLIAGEYRITEEGGRGLAVAAGPLAYCRTDADSGEYPVARGQWPGGGFEWRFGDETRDSADIPTDTPAAAAYRACRSSPVSAFSVTVDTTAFFDRNGRKTGYGSSAAACVLFCRFFAGDSLIAAVAEAAVRAHRAWQGGRGSGYDVLASAYGGAGAFTGGSAPAWTPLEWPRNLEAWVIRGPRAVRSPGAVSRYERWRRTEPTAAEALLSRSDETVNEMVRLLSNGSEPATNDIIDGIRNLAIIGRSIGEAVGVSAQPSFPRSLEGIRSAAERPGIAIKCLGAGNETALLAASPGALTPGERAALSAAKDAGSASPLIVRTEGLREAPDR